jgi:two-component system, OmpR family, sensor histidine kinase KdpD
VQFAREHGITHVIFGQSARSRWQMLIKGSVINRFLDELRTATVHIVPPGDDGSPDVQDWSGDSA